MLTTMLILMQATVLQPTITTERAAPDLPPRVSPKDAKGSSDPLDRPESGNLIPRSKEKSHSHKHEHSPETPLTKQLM